MYYVTTDTMYIVSPFLNCNNTFSSRSCELFCSSLQVTLLYKHQSWRQGRWMSGDTCYLAFSVNHTGFVQVTSCTIHSMCWSQSIMVYRVLYIILTYLIIKYKYHIIHTYIATGIYRTCKERRSNFFPQ